MKTSMEEILKPILKQDELGVPSSIITDLVFRLLFNEGDVNVARFSEVLRLHAQLLDDVLARMQQEHLVEVSKTGQIGRLSYTYTLTEAGTNRARDALERSQYIGPVPVNIETYKAALMFQTSDRADISPQSVKNALKFLILPDNFHRRVGPAVSARSSLFLYGPPGNGKTTISQALAKLLAGSEPIYIPYALVSGGQIIQIYDPLLHIPWEDKFPGMGRDLSGSGSSKTGQFSKKDQRWGLFQRPGVMAGGELTMESLDLRYDPIAKFYEAPLQLKANGGMLLIDDFGRQRMTPQELLNRWIVPLESGFDFLRMQTGQTIEIPFRQLIIFATNLDPSDLVDAAFMRRIQMKVEVGGPDEKLFYQIFTEMCKINNVPFDKDGFMHLLSKWYRNGSQVMQAVHPRDILNTLVAICEYEGIPPRLTPELLDEACASYFVKM
jgi:predicted ATPase with chaperone activity